MQTVNFLYKITRLKNMDGTLETTTIKVFDALQNYVVANTYDGKLSEEEISYYLQTNEKFNYKHFRIHFTKTTTVKF